MANVAKNILRACRVARPAACFLRVEDAYLRKCRSKLDARGKATPLWRKCMRPYESALEAVQNVIHPGYFTPHDPRELLRREDVEAAAATLDGARRDRRRRPRRR